MKTCFKCHHPKPLTEFYRHGRMGDGYLGKCKDCTRADVTANRQKNLERIRQYDRDRSKTDDRKRQFLKKNQAKRKAMGSAYMKAHNAVTRAVKNGSLIRPDHCQRCPATERIQAHHDSYERPLDVMWLCPVCHAQRHKELGRLRTLDRMYGEQLDPMPDR